MDRTGRARRILVCGGSGQLGRLVIERLLVNGAGIDLRVGTRTPEKLAHLRARGVTVIKLDFDDIGTLIAGFSEMDCLLLISPGSDPTRLQRLARLRTAIRVAEQTCVAHVVYPSLCGAAPSAQASVFAEHWQVEEALDRSALGWTVLRNGLYIDQFADALPLALHFGTYSVCHPEAPIAFVARADCASAICRALLSSDLAQRRRLAITGPATASREELVRFVADRLSRPILIQRLDLQDYRLRLLKVGLWKHVADATAELECAIGHNRFGTPSSDLSEILLHTPADPFAMIEAMLPDISAATHRLAGVGTGR